MLMVDEEKLSPEERLLRAVNKERDAPAPAGPSGKRPSWTEALKRTWYRFCQRVSELGQKARGFLELKFHELRERKILPFFSFPKSLSELRLNLRLVNRLLILAVTLTALYLVFDLVFFNPKKALDFRVEGTAVLPALFLEKVSPHPLEHYTDLAESRNLFQPYAARPPRSTEAQAKAAPAEGVLQNFKIVAVASVETGFEAIVEDVGQKETHFLKAGDRLQDYEVEKISWDTVVLKKNGERWELH